MNIDEKNADLWAAFYADRSPENQWALVLAYQSIADAQARKLYLSNLGVLDLDDLQTEARLGLFNAVGLYSPDRKTAFRTYAPYRVKGYLLDWMRRQDFCPRTVRAVVRKIMQATVVGGYDRCTPAVVAARLGVSEERFLKLCVDNHSPWMQSIDEKHYDRSGVLANKRSHDGFKDGTLSLDATLPSPVESPDAPAQRMAALAEILKGFDRDERLLILLYYVEGLTMAKIGEHLGCTESRVSQIHSNIKARLRAKSEYLQEVLFN